MDSFQTPKGTTLPFMNLRGKPYLQVAYRLVWFREDHPNAIIKTAIYKLTDDSAIVIAEIYGQDKGLLATGTKQESMADFKDFLEKAETGAIGRALAMCGYGTQFAPELDEGERLADSPIPRAKFKSEEKNPQKHALTFAQVLVAKKEITKPEILKILNSKADNVTDAIMALSDVEATGFLTVLRGKTNVK